MEVNRREFLKTSAIATGAMVVGHAAYAKPEDTDVLDPFVKATQKVLGAHFGGDLAEAILRDSWQEYEALLPEVPYIGGQDNLNANNLIYASYFLGVYRALKARGETVEEVGRIIYEIYEAMADHPKWVLRLVGSFKYGRRYERQWRKQALESQKRRYPGDWVFTFIEGDGEEFDYGIDMAECGICKLYHAQGAGVLAPYMCLGDFILSKAFDRGLVRYTTLAEGAGKCDFRYKKGRETFVYPLREGWPPQFRDEESRSSVKD